MAGYIGTQAVSVNTTSATISDDLSVGDDLTVTDDATIGGTLGVTGVLTGTSLDISGDIDVDGTTNLDVVNAVGAFSVTGTRAGDFLAKITSSNTFGLLVKTTSTSASHEQVQFVDANDSVLFKVLGNGAATIKTGLTLTDGNLVVASGHGIDFSATSDGAGTDSSELLDDYEEGAWTPSFLTGGTSISYNVQFGKYTKIGRIVYAELYIQGSITGNGQQIQVQGLPYNLRNENYARGGGMVGFESFVGTATPQFYGAQNTATFSLYREGDLGFTIANGTSVSSKYLIGVFVYPTAT